MSINPDTNNQRLCGFIGLRQVIWVQGTPWWVYSLALVALFLAACGSDPAQPIVDPTPTPVLAATVAPSITAVPNPAATVAPTGGVPTATPVPVVVGPFIPIPPERDLVALARRFRPGTDAGLAQFPVVTATDVGNVERFWLVDLAAPRVGQLNATLRLVTPHAAWYVGEGDSVVQSDLEAAAAVFEDVVYPQVTQAMLGFVPPPSDTGPGARITMLNTRLSGAAGYFASVDLYNAGVYDYTNSRPMLYLDAGAIRTRGSAFTSLVAHELQHLLHSYIDPTEGTWVNEGLSEAVSHLVVPGRRVTPPGGRSEVSLTRWPDHTFGLGRYYATANLFFRYMTNRYRTVDGLSRLIARPEDGIDGIEAFLDEVGLGEDFATVFQDWAVANLLGDDGHGVYTYGEGAGVNAVTPPRSISPGDTLEGTVVPFAADYVTLELQPGTSTLRFQGQATNAIIPTTPYSGTSCWWSNRGDSTHTRLSQEIDLTDVTQATLRFWAWYNLETPWDFLYVTASGDGGATWDILSGQHTIADNPVGTSYGHGLTGQSDGPNDGWIQETMDLTPYAGGRVSLAFEQVSDDAINLDGACIDDIGISEIGFFDDAETDGLWDAEGFVRTDNVLPQTFGVRIITIAMVMWLCRTWYWMVPTTASSAWTSPAVASGAPRSSYRR
ncbi:MAG: immune inhibitor A [Chloroflexi bacterium]|nr:immune inhibitor A [Chloroflexota bacterium]